MAIFKPPFATAVELDAIVLEAGELVFDTTNNTFRTGDGVTLGGTSDPTFVASGVVSDAAYAAGQATQDARLDVLESEFPSAASGTEGQSIVVSDSLTYILGPVIANPNILINSAFQINQEMYSGSSPLNSDAYGHDMWKEVAGQPQYTVSGQTLTTTVGGSLVQESEDLHALQIGDVVTASIQTGTVDLFGLGLSGAPTISPNNPHTFTVSTADGQFGITIGAAVSIAGLKLERGSVATPYQLPNATDEFLKCARYYMTWGIGSRDSVGTGIMAEANRAFVTLPTPTLLRDGGTFGPNVPLNDERLRGSGFFAPGDDLTYAVDGTFGCGPTPSGLVVMVTVSSSPFSQYNLVTLSSNSGDAGTPENHFYYNARY